MSAVHTERMLLKRAGVDTYQEPVVYMRTDCAVCRSEGFEAQTRVWVQVGSRRLLTTLNVVTDIGWLEHGYAALSEAAWRRLDPQPNETASFSHADAPESARLIRASKPELTATKELLRVAPVANAFSSGDS